MTDDELIEHMRVIVEARKVAGAATAWGCGSGRSNSLSLAVPLDVFEGAIGTVRLALRAVQGRPDRDCSATLIATILGRDLRAWRMDWRPANPHTNRCGPPSLRGLTSTTGIHEFGSNAALGLSRMQTENLPICIPSETEPRDFDAFLRYTYARLKITSSDPIPHPPWSSTFPF